MWTPRNFGRTFRPAFAAILVLGAALPARAAPACGTADPATATLVEKQGEVRFSNGYSGNQLQRRQDKASNGHSGSKMGLQWHPVGLTGRDLTTGFNVQVRGQPLQRGYCVSLASAEMTVGFERIEVLIDRRYRPGSCAYSVILEHEQQHVRNFRSTLAAYLPSLRRALEEAAANARPETASTLNGGAKRFIRYLESRVNPVLREMKQEMARLDAAMDTPAAYLATQARCDDW